MSILPQTNLRRPRARSRTPSRVPSPAGARRRRIPQWSWAGAVLALAGSAFIFAQRSALPRDALVTRVIDGDTVELAFGQRLRYIGIDAPETHRRVGAQWVAVHDAFGDEATQFNRALVEGKHVRLEYDVQPRDKYNRLLAYVYAGDTFVNAELVRAGFAHLLTIPPNVQHVDEFKRLAREAREAKRGLWATSR